MYVLYVSSSVHAHYGTQVEARGQIYRIGSMDRTQVFMSVSKVSLVINTPNREYIVANISFCELSPMRLHNKKEVFILISVSVNSLTAVTKFMREATWGKEFPVVDSWRVWLFLVVEAWWQARGTIARVALGIQGEFKRGDTSWLSLFSLLIQSPSPSPRDGVTHVQNTSSLLS